MNRSSPLPTLLLFFLVAILSTSIPGFVDDVNCWKTWSAFSDAYGLKNVYDSQTNYLPVYHYVLWLYGKLVGSANIGDNIYVLRWITLLVEMYGFWIVYNWTGRKTSYLTVMLLGIIPLGAGYNNLIWGQVDGILATLLFCAIYSAYQGKIYASCIWYTLAFGFKLQAICLLPLWGLLVLFHLFDRRSIASFLGCILSVAATAAVILLPFMFKDGGVQQVYNVLIGYSDSVPRLAVGAFNFWSWIKDDYLYNYYDNVLWFAGISYKTAGFIMFFSISAIILFPLLRIAFHKVKDKNRGLPNTEIVWLTAALLALVFYYFPTQMHERYSYPAYIFLLAYALYTRNFVPYILFSLAYFLNLEGILRSMQLENYNTLIFNQKFVSGLYLVNIFYLLAKLYRTNVRLADDETPVV